MTQREDSRPVQVAPVYHAHSSLRDSHVQVLSTSLPPQTTKTFPAHKVHVALPLNLTPPHCTTSLNQTYIIIMAKSSDNKAEPVAKHHGSEGKTEVRVPKHDASPKAKTKQSGRGWEIVDHSLSPQTLSSAIPTLPRTSSKARGCEKRST